MSLDSRDWTYDLVQHWQVLAPRIQQIEHLDGSSYYEDRPPTAFLSGMRSWDAWSKLAKPDLTTPGAKIPKGPGSPQVQTSALTNIPLELLHHLMDRMNRTDIFALGLTCEYMLNTVLQYIKTQYIIHAGPWAGVEIACTGTNLIDLPRANRFHDLVIESVEADMVKMIASFPPIEEFQLSKQKRIARCLNWVASSQYQSASDQGPRAWQAALWEFREREGRLQLSLSRWQDIEDVISCRLIFPPGQEFYCRNHNAAELFKCRPGPGMHGLVGHEQMQSSRHTMPTSKLIDAVLLQRICWTAPSLNPFYMFRSSEHCRDDFTRGLWAGHRFDIVSVKAHRAQYQGRLGPWTDISHQVV